MAVFWRPMEHVEFIGGGAALAVMRALHSTPLHPVLALALYKAAAALRSTTLATYWNTA